jgi:hypothetical protein
MKPTCPWPTICLHVPEARHLQRGAAPLSVNKAPNRTTRLAMDVYLTYSPRLRAPYGRLEHWLIRADDRIKGGTNQVKAAEAGAKRRFHRLVARESLSAGQILTGSRSVHPANLRYWFPYIATGTARQ